MSVALVIGCDYFWIQFCTVLLCNQAVLTLLLLHNLQEEPKDVKRETFNECFNLIFLYLLVTFTEYVPDAQIRDNTAKVFVGLKCTHAAYHLIAMLISSIKTYILGIRLLYRKCKAW